MGSFTSRKYAQSNYMTKYIQLISIAIGLILLSYCTPSKEKSTHSAVIDSIETKKTAIASIDSLKFLPEKRLFNTSDSSVAYPFFGKSKAERRIAEYLDSSFLDFHLQEPGTSIEEAIPKIMSDGLISLSFKDHHSNGYYSIKFENEWAAAYISYWTDFYTFDATTGRRLKLTDLAREGEADALLDFVRQQQKTRIQKHKNELLDWLSQGEVDSFEYQQSLDLLSGLCLPENPIMEFVVGEDEVEIETNCDFPRYMLPLSPSSTLVIKTNEIEKYLK